MNHRKSTVFLLFCAGKARTSYLKETKIYQFESGTNNIKFSFLERPDEVSLSLGDVTARGRVQD